MVHKVQSRSQTKQEEPTTNVIIKTKDDTIEITPLALLNTTDNNNEQTNNEQHLLSPVTIHLKDEYIELEVTPKLEVLPKLNDNNEVCPQSKPIQNLELWHQRMGHISPRMLQGT